MYFKKYICNSITQQISSDLSDINAWKWFAEDSIIQMIVILLKELPMDFIKHSCAYCLDYVNLIQD